MSKQTRKEDFVDLAVVVTLASIVLFILFADYETLLSVLEFFLGA